MNYQQIKYVRECLAIRERQLQDTYVVQPKMPHEIECYEKKVNEWREEARRSAGAVRAQIKRKIRSVEEHIILGSAEQRLAELLKELDGWKPTTN